MRNKKFQSGILQEYLGSMRNYRPYNLLACLRIIGRKRGGYCDLLQFGDLSNAFGAEFQ